MNATLDAARVSDSQVRECLHVLAAANHYQWVKWQRYIIPSLTNSDTSARDRLAAGELPAELMERLKFDAKTVVNLISHIIGNYAWPTPYELLYEHKVEQVKIWIGYALGKSESDHERWKLQCRTPFLMLSPEQRDSDYLRAFLDLIEIAHAGGLILPETMPVVPRATTARIKLDQFRHFQLGWHGNYCIKEQDQEWATTCIACHRENSGYAP